MEEERKKEIWMEQSKGKRMRSLIIRPGKDRNGNDSLQFSESKSHEGEQEKEKDRKKFRTEKRNEESWFEDEKEEEYKYRLVAKRSRYYSRSQSLKLSN